MVYPRRDGSRSLAKFVVLCAVTTCLLQGGADAKVHKKQAPSVAAVASTCQPDSEGDVAVGILVVSDSSCAQGGVGCIDDFCRFCKTKDTTESAHFIECSKVGWTVAPVAASVAPDVAADEPVPAVVAPPSSGDSATCKVDAGDHAAGVDVIHDESCAQGGLGCYNDHCRHCKYKESAESAHLAACDTYNQPAAGSGVGTTDPVSPPVSPATTPAPAVSVPGINTGCAYDVSPGDYSVGIQLVGDATCVEGGIGCFEDKCRYCKYHETPQSSHLVGCDALGYDFGAPVWNPADIDGSGAAPSTDSPVATPATDSPAETPATGSPAATPATGSPAETPATGSPAATPATGSPIPSPVVDTGCAYAVSDGDAAVGIQLVGDATCVSGGVGCFADVCRFCQAWSTPQSSHLIECAKLGVDFGTQPAMTPVPAGPTTPASEPGTTPAPATTVAPVVDPATGCPYPIADGDFAVGIQLVGDATCASGGLGCFKDVCRYCKYEETPQSKHFLSCADFGYPRTHAPTVAPVDTEAPTIAPVDTHTPTSAPVDTQAPTDAPVDTHAPTSAPVDTHAPTGAPVDTHAPTFAPVDITEPTVDPTTDCAYPVTEGDYKVGIQLVGDATCAAGGLGCFKDVCRYCQYRATPQSSHLMSCKGLGYDFAAGSDAEEPATDAPDVPVADPTTGCPFPVSEGDFSVGIQLVGDATCTSGGLGCFKNMCRYCKYEETPQSKHLLSCADFGYPHTQAPTFAPAEVIEPTDDEGSNSATPTDSPDIYDGSNDDDTPEPTPADGTDVPPTDETDAPPADETDAPPTDDETDAPPTDDETDAPPTDDETDAPPTDDETDAPPTDDETDAPPTDDETDAPPADDETDAPPADDETDAPPADGTEAPAEGNYGTGCPYPVAEGDFNVGIQLVGDASCVEGGLGCFKDVCRYCQFRKSAQSAHLMTCNGLGYDLGSGSDGSEPTTEEPVTHTADPATGCPYPVTEGDFSVGIQLVGDATCASGGLGCFKDVCRYCKYEETPQSKHFLSCTDFGYPRTHAPTVAPVDTEAPTFAPVDITEPTVDPETDCPYAVTEGDFKVGIQLVGDATCAAGGLGCFKDVCRYCKHRTTPQSSHLMSCKDLGYDFAASSDAEEPTSEAPVTTDPSLPTTCPLSATEGDLAVGIQLLSDASCAHGGLGCVADACRFCKYRDTPQSAHLLDCATFSTSKPSPSDGIPIGLPSDIDTSKCPFTASEGDLYIGVQIIEDATCDIGGAGCFHDACRFCKFFDTEKSSHLEDCSKFGYNFEPIATTAAPRPGVTTAPPPATAPPAVGPSAGCDQTASAGDKKVGVDMVTDASCVNGGVGCVADSVCRYCKTHETAANGHMEWCSTITGVAVDTAAPVSTAAPGSSSDDTSAPATVTPGGAGSATPCDQSVSEGDKKAGIDMITDASCLDGGVGCLPDSTCRHCKHSETAASAHLLWCNGDAASPPAASVVATAAPDGSAPDAPVAATVAPAPAAPTVDASAPCTDEVSPGDAAQGIALATDPLCADGGLGCLPASTCRYCKHWSTTASAHLEWCAGYDGYVPPTAEPIVDTAATTTPAPTLDPSACSTEVAPGDAEAGVAAVHDESCLKGGMGCFGGVCRFCQVFESDKSAHLLPCGATMVRTVAPLRFAANVRTNAAKNKNQLDELFKNATFKWSVAGAACVGVVAVVALFGLGAKRALTRVGSRKSSSEEATTDAETETDAATVTVTAVTSSDSDDADAEEVHV